MKTVLTVVGARPQFVKAAAVSRAMLGAGDFREVLVHTGQHFDSNMSSIFFEELAIPEPDLNLDIHGGSHGRMTGRMLESLEEAIQTGNPDIVLVYGDTNSTLAGALAATKLHVPVAHVEAGLRSFNRKMPEEINRVVTDHVSDLLFCPTVEAVENLRREGITGGVHHVGDVMYDATLHAKAIAEQRSDIRRVLGLPGGQYSVCTIHRAENTDDPQLLAKLLAFIESEEHGRTVVFPVHPRTRDAMKRYGISAGVITLIEPVGYLDMNALLSGASVVYTDSGGLQKEAYFHGVPCVTLRGETEWVETVRNGWNRLWITEEYSKPRSAIEEYGSGDAAPAVIEKIREFLDTRSDSAAS